MDKALITEQNLIDVPLYTPLDVSRYLRTPVWLIAGMWRSRFWQTELFQHWFDRRPPYFGLDEDIEELPELPERWSFRQFADLTMRLFAVDSLLELARNEPKDGGRAELLVGATRRILQTPLSLPVFFGHATPKDGITQLLQSCCDRLSEPETRWLEKRLLSCLDRFEMEEGTPRRLYPFSRNPVEASPRVIVIDPGIRFGRPTIAGHGTPTDMLRERHQAGDSIADLAEDYKLPASKVEEAIRYEAIPLSLMLPFFWW